MTTARKGRGRRRPSASPLRGRKAWARGVALAFVLVGTAGALAAQAAPGRTPNLGGAWTAPTGVVQFNFVHRFEMSAAPLRKVTNSPTFLVASGVTRGIDAGFNWASASDLVPAYPNEWEFFARAAVLRQSAEAPLDLGAEVAYNVASESVDGEVSASRGWGPVRLFGAARWFSAAYAARVARWALGGGASVRLTPRLAVAGDYATLVDAAEGEPGAWGAGLQVGVPYTPHSLSIHATNVATATLEGRSRGSRTLWGFEYTVPVTLGRYFGGGAERVSTASPGTMAPAGARTGRDTVRVDIQALRYARTRLEVAPGTTVVWANRDPVVHTVTSADGSFDSGAIEPGESWSHTFEAEGEIEYSCTPHPFMTGAVVVRLAMEEER